MIRTAYRIKNKRFQCNIEVYLLIFFFAHQILIPSSVYAFPTLHPPAGHIYVRSFLPYYEAKGPCNCHFRAYTTSDMRSRSSASGFDAVANMALVPDTFARFNIHLYLDHMWHLNIGFSK